MLGSPLPFWKKLASSCCLGWRLSEDLLKEDLEGEGLRRVIGELFAHWGSSGLVEDAFQRDRTLESKSAGMKVAPSRLWQHLPEKKILSELYKFQEVQVNEIPEELPGKKLPDGIYQPSAKTSLSLDDLVGFNQTPTWPTHSSPFASLAEEVALVDKFGGSQKDLEQGPKLWRTVFLQQFFVARRKVRGQGRAAAGLELVLWEQQELCCYPASLKLGGPWWRALQAQSEGTPVPALGQRGGVGGVGMPPLRVEVASSLLETPQASPGRNFSIVSW